MLIPKKARKAKPVEKKCEYPGCENLFWGSHSAKYCTVHRDPKNRPKKQAQIEDVTKDNQIIEHDRTEVEMIQMKCALEGCENEFEIKLYPKQYVYPKFCSEHRNEQKRKNFLNERSQTV
ncbi:MAG: hypothetical protein ACLFQB_09720 [Chitinispirillaceae bacterium]